MLSDTVRGFTRVRAAAFAMLAAVTGHRPRPGDPRGWGGLALSNRAVTTGLLVRGWSDPTDLLSSIELIAHGSTAKSSWMTATLVAASVLLDAIEPNPDAAWDEDRIAELRARAGDIAEAVRSAAATLRRLDGSAEG